MSWQHWIIAAWLVISAIQVVANVGKHREPITPGTAAASVVLVTLWISLLALG